MTIKEQLKAKEIDISEIELPLKEKQLFKYVKENNQKQIRQLISQGVDINAKDKDGWTALMNATDTDSYNIVKTLVEFGADIDLQDDDGQTALMNAIFVNATTTAKFLISSGANVNIKDNNGQTPLMIAALCDSKEIGELLILNGAKLLSVDNLGKTAFMIAHETWTLKKSDYFLKGKLNYKEITEKRIEYFFHTIPGIKKYGSILNISAFINEFNNKYDENIGKGEFKDFVDIFNSNNCDRIINYLDNNTIQIYPSSKEIYEFLFKLMKTIYLNNKIISINDIKNHFSKKYNCILDKTQLNDFVNSFNEYNLEKDLEIRGDTISVYIKQGIILDFLFSLFKPIFDEYKTMEIKVIQDAFIKKFHFDVTIDELDSYISVFNMLNLPIYALSPNGPYKSRRIVRIGPDTIQVYPTEKESVDFIESLFLHKSVNDMNVEDVYIAFFQNYNCKLDETELSKLVNYYNDYTNTKYFEIKDSKLFLKDFCPGVSIDSHKISYSHSFSFDGGDLLSKIGASWFVSYSYYEKLEFSHTNWSLISTASSRISTYKSTRRYHESWLKEVLLMDSSKLQTNHIGLSSSETKRMAKEILMRCYNY